MKHKNTNREYAFLMIEYETPKFIKDLQNSIKKEELYTEEDNKNFHFSYVENGKDKDIRFD